MDFKEIAEGCPWRIIQVCGGYTEPLYQCADGHIDFKWGNCQEDKCAVYHFVRHLPDVPRMGVTDLGD